MIEIERHHFGDLWINSHLLNADPCQREKAPVHQLSRNEIGTQLGPARIGCGGDKGRSEVADEHLYAFPLSCAPVSLKVIAHASALVVPVANAPQMMPFDEAIFSLQVRNDFNLNL